MTQYIGQRLSAVLPVLLLVSMAIFAIMHILPGDPIEVMLAGAEAGLFAPERLAELRKSMGLDQPLYIQYGRFVLGALRGDLGESIRFRRPVSELVAEAALQTVQLSLVGLLVALITSLPLGITAALYENTWIDTICMVVALFAISMPLFWLGQLLVVFVSIRLQWLPAISGYQAKGIILPALTLGLVSAGLTSRLMRSSLIEVLHNDYIRTARAKGLKEWRVIIRHALKNALIPVITIVGLQFGNMLSGAVIAETVFSRPGLGTLVVNGILWQDYPLVQGTVLFIGASYVLVNLLVDLVCAWLDPRIRYS